MRCVGVIAVKEAEQLVFSVTLLGPVFFAEVHREREGGEAEMTQSCEHAAAAN